MKWSTQDKLHQLQLLIEYNYSICDMGIALHNEAYATDGYATNKLHDITKDTYPTRQKTNNQVDQTELYGVGTWDLDIKNNLNMKSCYYNFCSADMRQFIILKAHMIYIMQQLFSELLAASIFSVDSQQLKKYFYMQGQKDPNRKDCKMIKNNLREVKTKRKRHQNHKTESCLFGENKENVIHITIQNQCMHFKMSLYKYSVMKLLLMLSKVDNLTGILDLASRCDCVSLPRFGNWYCQNICQGFFLRTLLCNISINTVNVCRNLYFILITDRNPNVNVQINVSLMHSVYAVFENQSSNVFSFRSVDWNANHRKVISTAGIAVYLSNTWNQCNPSKWLKAISYPTPLSNRGNRPVEQSSQTEKQQTVTYMDTGSNAFLSSTDSSAISIKLSMTEVAVQTDSELRLSNSKESNTISTCSGCDLALTEKISWLIELQKFKAINAKNNLCNLVNEDMIDETIFEATSIEGYDKYYKPFSLGVDLCLKVGKAIMNVFVTKTE